MGSRRCCQGKRARQGSATCFHSYLSAPFGPRRHTRYPRLILHRYVCSLTGRTSQHGDIVPLMYEFTRWEEEPEPQVSSNRLGPPHKWTSAGLLDPSQFPSIRPRCFGCSQGLTFSEIGHHIRSCDRVSAQDLARFKTALIEFEMNPARAREVVEQFLIRIHMNSGFDTGD